MRIQEMFYDDIDRKINGVVKVDQDAADVLKQEVKEYVITRDIRKHMITFFNNYAESFREPTADVGVWISGFFGSGKSHFLKMLSYLLENKEVDERRLRIISVRSLMMKRLSCRSQARSAEKPTRSCSI